MKNLGIILRWDHCHRFSPSETSNNDKAGFESARKLTSGFPEWRCAVVITTTPRYQGNDRLIVLCSSNDLFRVMLHKGKKINLRTNKGIQDKLIRCKGLTNPYFGFIYVLSWPISWLLCLSYFILSYLMLCYFISIILYLSIGFFET